MLVEPEILGLSDVTSVAEAFPAHGEETEHTEKRPNEPSSFHRAIPHS